MTWYYNNEGVADGPHDEEAMRDLVSRHRVSSRTLIWNPSGENWQEVSAALPSWWQSRSSTRTEAIKGDKPAPAPVVETVTATATASAAAETPQASPSSSANPGTRPLNGDAGTSRNFAPVAPSNKAKADDEKPGLLKRLFGFGKKS